jgi:hypothetical protein
MTTRPLLSSQATSLGSSGHFSSRLPDTAHLWQPFRLSGCPDSSEIVLLDLRPAASCSSGSLAASGVWRQVPCGAWVLTLCRRVLLATWIRLAESDSAVQALEGNELVKQSDLRGCRRVRLDHQESRLHDQWLVFRRGRSHVRACAGTYACVGGVMTDVIDENHCHLTVSFTSAQTRSHLRICQ